MAKKHEEDEVKLGYKTALQNIRQHCLSRNIDDRTRILFIFELTSQALETRDHYLSDMRESVMIPEGQ